MQKLGCRLYFILLVAFGFSNASANCEQKGEIINNTEFFLEHNKCHDFFIDAQINEYVEIIVHQKGVDVELKLSDDNREIQSSDSPNANSGYEFIVVRMPETKKYQIRVSWVKDEPKYVGNEGFYNLKFQKRTATATDRNFVDKFNNAKALDNVKNYAASSEIYKSLPQNEIFGYKLCLNNSELGNIYNSAEKYDEAIFILRENIALAAEIHADYVETVSQMNLGAALLKTQNSQSIETLRKAVSGLEKLYLDKIGDKQNLPKTYFIYANALNDSGQKDKAVEVLEKIRRNFREPIETYFKATIVLADIYRNLEDTATAAELLAVDLPENLNRNIKGHFYKVKGKLYMKNDKAQALDFFTLASAMFETDEAEVAGVNLFIGNTYLYNQDYATAALFYEKAELVFSRANDKENAAQVLNNLGVISYYRADFNHAVDYCEKALRLNMELGIKINQTRNLINLMHFQKENSNARDSVVYGKLAINLLVNIKYSDIKNLEAETKQILQSSFADDFRELADTLIKLDRVSEAEQVLYFVKEKEYLDYVDGNDELNGIQLTADERTFAAAKGFNVELQPVGKDFSPSVNLLKMLNSKGDNTANTVFVSTVTAKNAVSLIVTTNNRREHFRIIIKKEALEKMVSEYRDSIINLAANHQTRGNKLYKLLLSPLEKTFAENKTTKVVWFLDGVLRLLPTASIFDGKQYLIERFSNAQLTFANDGNVVLPRTDELTAIGLAASESFENLPMLDQAVGEIECVIAEKKKLLVNSPCKTGIVKGNKFADDDFTKELLENAFKKYQLIHIAGHFVMQSGNFNNSFLVLGGGNNRKYSIKEFAAQHLEKVELLTLSACDTANLKLTDSFESFATMAQKRGAKAVLGTLWAVDDSSTTKFMREFYKAYQINKLDKTEALKVVQKSFISGKKYSHPFYWSTFALYGNWK